MLFIITCTDKKDSLSVRKETRAAHLQYLADAGARIKLAGPRMSPGSDPHPIGSMILLDADSEGAAILFAEHDPYNKAGLFEKVTIDPWTCALGAWKPKD